MSAKLGNLLCFVIAASAFAMIGLDATAHHGSTHSGTQEYVRHDCAALLLQDPERRGV